MGKGSAAMSGSVNRKPPVQSASKQWSQPLETSTLVIGQDSTALSISHYFRLYDALMFMCLH